MRLGRGYRSWRIRWQRNLGVFRLWTCGLQRVLWHRSRDGLLLRDCVAVSEAHTAVRCEGGQAALRLLLSCLSSIGCGTTSAVLHRAGAEHGSAFIYAVIDNEEVIVLEEDSQN